MSARPPPAVIFDLDGTLVDSAPDVAFALNLALADTAIIASVAEVRGWIGNGARALVSKALRAREQGFDDAQLDALTAGFVAAYARNPVENTQLYPHVAETLAQLADAGVPVGVCTNKAETVARQVLDGFGLSAYVQSLVGGGRAFKPKPYPHGLIACAARLGRLSIETVFVGDSKIDLDTARAAACRSVLVTYGYSASPVAGLGADACIGSLAELSAVLGRLGAADNIAPTEGLLES